MLLLLLLLCAITSAFSSVADPSDIVLSLRVLIIRRLASLTVANAPVPKIADWPSGKSSSLRNEIFPSFTT